MSLPQSISPSPTPRTSGESFLRDDDLVGRVARDDGDGVRAAHLRERRAHRVDEARRRRVERLGRRGARRSRCRCRSRSATPSLSSSRRSATWFSMMPLCTTATSPGDVRVRVRLARPAVRRPARVADAGRAGERRLLRAPRRGSRACRPRARSRRRVAVVDGEPGRVVAAVLELAEPLDEDGRALLGPDVADDSAHAYAALAHLERSNGLAPPNVSSVPREEREQEDQKIRKGREGEWRGKNPFPLLSPS